MAEIFFTHKNARLYSPEISSLAGEVWLKRSPGASLTSLDGRLQKLSSLFIYDINELDRKAPCFSFYFVQEKNMELKKLNNSAPKS